MSDWYRTGEGKQQFAEHDPIVKAAKLALSNTGQDQTIHEHKFGEECNSECKTLSRQEKTGGQV